MSRKKCIIAENNETKLKNIREKQRGLQISAG
jgi:hypothetical protein